MTRPETWEAVGREALYYVLVCLAAEIEESVEPVADAVYWGGDPDAEQVERLRRLSFEFEYAVEAYVATLCDSTEPWGGHDARVPPWERDFAWGVGDAAGDGATDDEAPDDEANATDGDENASDDAGESAAGDEPADAAEAERESE